MAELLVMARDADPHAEPSRDRMRYRRGMPVVVMPDGHPWGRMEGPPDFYVLRLPGVSVAEAEQFVAPQYPADYYQPASFWLKGDTVPFTKGAETVQIPRSIRPYRRRDWVLQIDSLPPAALEALEKRGALTVAPDGDVTWADLKPALWSNRLQRTEQRNSVRKPLPNALDADPVKK